MPRRKQYKYAVKVSDADFYQQAVDYLRKKSESADFDLGTIELHVKKKLRPALKTLTKPLTTSADTLPITRATQIMGIMASKFSRKKR
jgi:hypothetical protein